MSGIAIAASMIPGSVATFCSCSSDWSSAIASSSSRSANTRAGTRISLRAVAGISQLVSSSRRSSDIEYDVGAPALAGGLEREPVVGDCLYEARRVVRCATHPRVQALIVEPELLEPARHEP